MEDIKICILGFFTESTPDPQAVARKGEALGFDGLYVGDHPVMPAMSQGLVGSGATASHSRLEGNQYPEFYSHMPDPFLLLMAAAGATSRLKIGAGVTLV